MSPQERDDKLLQEYLAGDSALSRLYRDRATEQPDARLDATIRARAHAAVARDARVAHSPFAHNWIVPTSLAAVLVLSVSVVVLMPEPVDVPKREEAGAAAQAAAGAKSDGRQADTKVGHQIPRRNRDGRSREKGRDPCPRARLSPRRSAVRSR